MKTLRLSLQAIAATGLLAVAGMGNPASVSSQQAMSELGNPCRAPLRISKTLASSRIPLKCILPSRTGK